MLGKMRSQALPLAVLVLCVAACAPAPPPTSPPSNPSPVATIAATPGAAPSAAIRPATTWVGAPITVAEAVDHRDHHLDDTELAVAGFAWRPAGSIYCPAILLVSPAMEQCPDNLTWISDVDPGPQTGPEFIEPDQPAIELLVRPDTYAQVPLPPQPGRVIVLGHFDDHRSADCPQAADCKHNFLVDAILDPHAPSLDRGAVDGRQIESGLTTMFTAQNVVKTATGLLPGADRVVVASPVSGKTVASYEPRANFGALTTSNAVWLIRYLGRTDNRPVLKTVLIADRSDLLAGYVFPMTRDTEVAKREIVNP